MRKHCLKWIDEEQADRRPFILLTANKLKEKYRELKGKAPKAKWKGDDLITEILRSDDETAPPRRTNDVKDPNSLEQELMNIVIRGMALKPMEGEAKDHCQKGHEMEGVFSKQLISEPDFPYGEIEEINQVRLVKKMEWHT